MIICIQDDEWLDFVPFMASLLVNESDVCIDEACKIPDGRWYHFTKDQSWLALDMESKAGKVDVVRHRFYRNSLLWSLVVNQIRSADVLYEKKPPKAFETKMCGGTICARSTELWYPTHLDFLICWWTCRFCHDCTATLLVCSKSLLCSIHDEQDCEPGWGILRYIIEAGMWVEDVASLNIWEWKRSIALEIGYRKRQTSDESWRDIVHK